MELSGSALESALIRLTAAVETLTGGDAEAATIPYTLAQLLEIAVEHRASLLHINAGSPPILRIEDQLVPVGSEPISRGDCRKLLMPLLASEQLKDLYAGSEIDLCYPAAKTGFRLNVYLERGCISASIRRLRSDIPMLETLGLSGSAIEKALSESSGLVILTGSPRCGKLNTLAALVQHINSTRVARVISLEHPIQFWHHNQRSIIVQREIGNDTGSFAQGVQQAVLQDPDVICLTELPDRETAEFVIRAAGGGHLIIAVLDATSSVRALERLISTFQGQTDGRIIGMLADALRLVVCQTLVARADGRGMLPAFEILVNTEEVSNELRHGSVDQLHWIMQENGMQTLGRGLKRLVDDGLVTKSEALSQVDGLEDMMSENDVTSPSDNGAASSEDAGETPLMAWL